jgi:uncharacterized protein DUF1707/2TM domain-containing protein
VAGELQRRDQMRPSDDARQRAADALRAHYADGRLDDVELERRVELALNARTRSDLKALFRDLPWDPRSSARSERFWGFQRRLLRAHTAAYVVVNGLLVGIWALTGGGEFWPAASIAGWGAFLGGHWAIAFAVRRSRGASRRELPRATRRALGR